MGEKVPCLEGVPPSLPLSQDRVPILPLPACPSNSHDWGIPPPGPGQEYPSLPLTGVPLPTPARPEHRTPVRRGQYTSCVHTGGLSCLLHMFGNLNSLQFKTTESQRLFNLKSVTFGIQG